MLEMTMNTFTYSQFSYFDTDFGNKGISKIDILNSSVDYCNAMKVQKDGKILLVGSSNLGFTSQISVVRINSNGTLDESFANNGIFGYQYNNEKSYAEDIELLEDGNMLIAGYAAEEHILLMLTKDGELNKEFNNDGIAYGFSKGRCFDICNSDNGYIYLLGDDNFLKLTRLMPDGELDSTFGQNGIAETIYNAHNGSNYLILESGEPLLLGNYGSEYDHYFFAAKFDTLGIIDSTFNNDGYINYSFEQYDYAGGLCSSESGDIFISGVAVRESDGGYESKIVLQKYDKTGKEYIDFGNNGIFEIDNVLGIGLRDILLLDNEKVLLAGVFIDNNNSYMAIMRINADGTIDNSFGDSGVISSDVINAIYSLERSPDQKILAAGLTYTSSTKNDFGIVQFNSVLTSGLYIENQKNINLYPNPINKDFYINGDFFPTESISIKLYDLNGKYIYSFENNHKINNADDTIHLSLPSSIISGVYLVKIKTLDDIYIIKVLVN